MDTKEKLKIKNELIELLHLQYQPELDAWAGWNYDVMLEDKYIDNELKLVLTVSDKYVWNIIKDKLPKSKELIISLHFSEPFKEDMIKMYRYENTKTK